MALAIGGGLTLPASAVSTPSPGAACARLFVRPAHCGYTAAGRSGSVGMSDGQSIEFPTTRWTGVAIAGHQDTAGRVALGELLVRYAAPLRAHLVLQKCLQADQAEDLLQAFIADRVLEKD